MASGADILKRLSGKIKINGIIGLEKNKTENVISGFTSMRGVARELRVPFIAVKDYGLRHPSDRKRLLDLTIDVLFVLGWQRLVPRWLLDHCRYAAVGIHGSPYGITLGRGRSPQNWAIIFGAKKFELSLFRLDEGIDSGPIIATRTFKLSSKDDIQSSYDKVTRHTSRMILESLKNGSIQSGNWKAQRGRGEYFPQRKPEDGEIDWRRDTQEILRFIRALTRPYPGAFSRVKGGRLVVWKAKALKLKGSDNVPPGKIIARLKNGDLQVKTSDGFLLIYDYSLIPAGKASANENDILPSCDFVGQMRRIIKRHQSKYPNLPISKHILRLEHEGSQPHFEA